ncbi:MAG: RHS repeat-associated core domain-containing protein [Candidatus Electrothrix sp. AW2]|nr:RHS repeat-associated core domain-containing protein [Candidatus Electrothrix gigas]
MYQHLEYFPFGETWIEEVSNQHRVPFLFTAKELDRETGLYYFGARYYDPRTSVWQSTDPILGDYLDIRKHHNVYNPLNLSLYTYGYNNPVISVDPDGNIIFTAILVAGALWSAYDVYKAGEQAYTETGSIGEAIKAGTIKGGTDAAIGIVTGGAGKLLSKGGKLLMKTKPAKRAAKYLGGKIEKGVAKLFKKSTKGGFSSSDPYVADLANEIEGMYPGHVKGVNVPLKDGAGNLVTDADILLENSVIQVKSGGGKGLTSQVLTKTPKGTDLPVIGYGPDLKGSVVKGIEKAGGLVTTDKSLLIDVAKP